MSACMFYMALVTTMVLYAGSQDSLLSASVRRVHVVFSTAGFKGGEKPCHKNVKPPRYVDNPVTLAYFA